MTKFGEIAVDVKPLRESKGFRYLLAGQSIGWLGKHMRIVALAWQVYSITGSSVAVGMLGLTEVVPLIALSSVAGSIADTHDRRRVMWWSQVGSIFISLALAALAVVDAPPLLAVYALSAAAASFDAFDTPARLAILPALVGWEGIAPAFALRQIIMQISQIIGPALGGVLIGAFSVGVVYLVDAGTFVVSIATLSFVPSVIPAPSKHVSRLEAIKEGLRWALGRRLLRSIFLIDLAAMVFGMPRALFPELADEVFGIGATGLGMLYAAPGVGALLGAMLSGWVGKVSRQGVAIFLAVGAWGLSVTLVGVMLSSLVATLLLLTTAGAADVLSAVFRGTLLQQSTPDELRGRVTSINTLATVGGPRLGDIEAGTAAALLGLRGSIVFGGVACLAFTALIGWRYPELRRYRRTKAPVAEGLPMTELP
jgi:MFS family permease